MDHIVQYEFDLMIIVDCNDHVSKFLVVLFKVHGSGELGNVIFFGEMAFEIEIFSFGIVVQHGIFSFGKVFVQYSIGKVIHAFDPLSFFIVELLLVGQIGQIIDFSVNYKILFKVWHNLLNFFSKEEQDTNQNFKYKM